MARHAGFPNTPEGCPSWCKACYGPKSARQDPRGAARRSPTAGNRGNGGKWIRPKKRAQIYFRDSYRCVWCEAAVIPRLPDVQIMRGIEYFPATLDHVVPRSEGGTNAAHNLITACARCNARRRECTVMQFAVQIAPHGFKGVADTLARIVAAIERPLAQ